MTYQFYLLYNSIIFLYQMNTSFLKEKSPTCLKNTSLLKNYLQINIFLDLVLMEQELKYTLYKQKLLEEL